MAACLALTTCGTPEAGLLPPLATGLLSGVAFLAFTAASPDRSGPWHHSKLRFPAAVLTLAAPALAATMVVRPELAGTVAAWAILLRHQSGGTALAATARADLEALRVKVIALEAARRLPPREPTFADDKADRAG
jgi:uncharacterized caspase-like protein